MKKKRYLMIVCLLSSPSFFINVEASDGGSSSVGIEFYQNPRTPAPNTTGSQLPRTGSKSQANLSILGLALIGLAGMVHRKKGRHEAN
ncbi:LPXTG cell wall anchor domain-containing protein [Enterococcus faecalis]|uniref:LPXTG cell wall anchor domain-containing protein n=1 Tax=Enterococcus faecalis TaxID=1351 RepID=UPI0022E7A545|nr:LPXTG cell wall anchor domain-containing protein [Enterococcus faecalis]